MGQEKGLYSERKGEEDEKELQRKMRGVHTGETEGESRGGVLEDEADERLLKMYTTR